MEFAPCMYYTITQSWKIQIQHQALEAKKLALQIVPGGWIFIIFIF